MADSDLPAAVQDYFRGRQKDLSDLDDVPQTKRAFKDLPPAQLAALELLNTLGEAIEGDHKNGKHVGKKAEAAPTPAEKLQTYIYAIH
jgi:hypothetical protein